MFSKGIRSILLISAVSLGTVITAAATGYAQATPTPAYQSQEVSEADGIPVLIKHLPEWEKVRNTTAFAKDPAELKAALGEMPILDLIDFTAGTEAVSAVYPTGRLLIVEFTSPQGSVDADTKIVESLAAANDGKTAYRRIGNYNVFVFGANDITAANTLIDQVKYEKNIQWLGDNPFRITAERAFILTTSDIFLSTVLVIVLGIAFAIVGGSITGFVYFQMRERRRAAMSTYTDAGGMTRLNLDGFTPDMLPERLLKDHSS